MNSILIHSEGSFSPTPQKRVTFLPWECGRGFTPDDPLTPGALSWESLQAMNTPSQRAVLLWAEERGFVMWAFPQRVSAVELGMKIKHLHWGSFLHQEGSTPCVAHPTQSPACCKAWCLNGSQKQSLSTLATSGLIFACQQVSDIQWPSIGSKKPKFKLLKTESDVFYLFIYCLSLCLN